MRRLNPILKRRILWVVNPALISVLCIASDRLSRLVDSHSRYQKPLERLLEGVGAMGFFAAQVAFGAGIYLVSWLADSIKQNGWAKSFFFDPVLAKLDSAERSRVPSWVFFFLRATLLVGLFIAFTTVADGPYVPGRESQTKFLRDVSSLLFGFLFFFLPVAALRYSGVDDTLSGGNPQLYPYLNGLDGLLSVTPPKLHFDRERRTEVWWDMTVLAHRSYEAEGKFADGTAFSIKLERRTPWFRFSRLAVVFRVCAAESRTAAIVSAKDATVFPTEATVNLEPILGEAQAFLLSRDSSFLVVTTRYVQATLPRISDLTEAFEAVCLARRIQVGLQVSRDGGYRGDSPLSATPAEIARIEAIAEEAWTSFPSKPRGSQP